MKETPNPLSFQARIDPEDFLPASDAEKQSLVVMRESVGFWKDGLRRLRKNRVAMISLFVIIVIMIFSFIVPQFYPYSYAGQINAYSLMDYLRDHILQAIITVAIIAFVFIKLFGTAAPGSDTDSRARNKGGDR